MTPAAARPAFRKALAEVWDDREARRFTVFVFVSMLAYSAQDLILEPFAGSVFAYTPGQTTQLSGLQRIVENDASADVADVADSEVAAAAELVAGDLVLGDQHRTVAELLGEGDGDGSADGIEERDRPGVGQHGGAAAELPVGVTGLMITELFSAAMGTSSSILNSVSTMVSVDFYEKIAKKPDQVFSIKLAEWVTVIAGLIGIGLAILLSRFSINSFLDTSIELVGLFGGGEAPRVRPAVAGWEALPLAPAVEPGDDPEGPRFPRLFGGGQGPGGRHPGGAHLEDLAQPQCVVHLGTADADLAIAGGR